MEASELKRRMVAIDSWLYGPADRFGECDDCHDETIALWDDIDTEGAGDFSSCRDCWQKRRASVAAAFKRITSGAVVNVTRWKGGGA